VKFGTFDIEGFSLGGIETCLRVPQWNVAFDVGRGRDETIRCNHLALTHTHMDHAGGLAYLLAQRQLFSMAPPQVIVPVEMVDKLRAMLDAWQPLQRYELAADIVPIAAGERVQLRRGLALEAFRTYHPVPSVGYSVIETVHKLRSEFMGRPGQELAELKRQGTEITQAQERRLLSVTGDTLPVCLDRNPQIMDSQVLVIECTFLDERKPKAAVVAGGHVHLDDLVDRVGAFKGQHLVLSHFSQMYNQAQIEECLGRLTGKTGARIYGFPTSPDQSWIGPLGAGDDAPVAHPDRLTPDERR
jgi:ribonuclease Z